MFVERRIVDNRTLLLGLDKLYCEAMKRHERGELLHCARRVAAVLHIAPEAVPVEGYYAEDEQLTEFFRLVRALQEVSEERKPAVASLAEFQRLWDVTSAPLYGKPILGALLPQGRDALSQALNDTDVSEWSVRRLTETTHRVSQETDDFSLVGLAALAQDEIVLTVTRESVVLYAEAVLGAPLRKRPKRSKYIWKVDKELAARARRFTDTFSTLFGDKLPPPEPAQAEIYWHACQDNQILGRCVRIGYNNAVSPALQYHWAVCRTNDDTFGVQEFWQPEVWTTERYRSALRYNGRCPNL